LIQVSIKCHFGFLAIPYIYDRQQKVYEKYDQYMKRMSFKSDDGAIGVRRLVKKTAEMRMLTTISRAEITKAHRKCRCSDEFLLVRVIA